MRFFPDRVPRHQLREAQKGVCRENVKEIGSVLERWEELWKPLESLNLANQESKTVFLLRMLDRSGPSDETAGLYLVELKAESYEVSLAAGTLDFIICG